MLSRTMLPPPGADCQLLAREEFQAHSSSVLRSLMHVGLDTLPLLHNFSRLKQVRQHWPQHICRLAVIRRGGAGC